MLSIGAFGGPYGVYWRYEANELSTGEGGNGANQVLNHNLLQSGYSYGNQLSIQYHFPNIYYVGAIVSVEGNTNKTLLTDTIDNAQAATNSAFNINHQFRLNYNLDLGSFIGVDVAPHTHLYLKGGGSLARLGHYLFVTQAQAISFPMPFLQQTQNKNIWGWMMGLGLVRDINRWVSTFAEYDYYDYGIRALNALNDYAPFMNPATQANSLTHRIDIHVSALHLGLNVNFGDNYFPNDYWMIRNPWMGYIGGFVSSYRANFQYGGNFFSNQLGAANQIFNDLAAQQGISGGGQIGVRYHFSGPYYLGVTYSAMANAHQARLTKALSNTVASVIASDVTYSFRLNHNQDITALLGADLTPQTSVYVKGGGSRARFSNQIVVTRGQFMPVPIPFFQHLQHKTFWGLVLGLGFTRDINRWISAFAEYNYYHYARRELSTLDNFTQSTGAGTEANRITQHVAISASAVRLGLNFNWGNTFFSVIRKTIVNHWMLYAGAFEGYYGMDFFYGGNYFGSRNVQGGGSNNIFNNDALQSGSSTGGQVGIQYHLSTPYYFGAVFSGMANWGRAFITEIVENVNDPALLGFNISHQFRLKYNLDIAGIIGADITPKTHAYVKAGGSYARLNDHFSVNQTWRSVVPMPQTPAIPNRRLWGWIVGLGLSRDIGRHFNLFAEYDYYDYGNRNLISMDNFTPRLDPDAGGRDRLTQHVAISGSSVRVGMNVKFPI